jgi:hypothetical protein
MAARPKRKTPPGANPRNYVEDRKSWYKKVKLDELLRDHAREGDSKALSAVERGKRRRKKAAGE